MGVKSSKVSDWPADAEIGRPRSAPPKLVTPAAPLLPSAPVKLGPPKPRKSVLKRAAYKTTRPSQSYVRFSSKLPRRGVSSRNDFTPKRLPPPKKKEADLLTLKARIDKINEEPLPPKKLRRRISEPLEPPFEVELSRSEDHVRPSTSRRRLASEPTLRTEVNTMKAAPLMLNSLLEKIDPVTATPEPTQQRVGKTPTRTSLRKKSEAEHPFLKTTTSQLYLNLKRGLLNLWHRAQPVESLEHILLPRRIGPAESTSRVESQTEASINISQTKPFESRKNIPEARKSTTAAAAAGRSKSVSFLPSKNLTLTEIPLRKLVEPEAAIRKSSIKSVATSPKYIPIEFFDSSHRFEEPTKSSFRGPADRVIDISSSSAEEEPVSGPRTRTNTNTSHLQQPRSQPTARGSKADTVVGMQAATVAELEAYIREQERLKDDDNAVYGPPLDGLTSRTELNEAPRHRLLKWLFPTKFGQLETETPEPERKRRKKGLPKIRVAVRSTGLQRLFEMYINELLGWKKKSTELLPEITQHGDLCATVKKYNRFCIVTMIFGTMIPGGIAMWLALFFKVSYGKPLLVHGYFYTPYFINVGDYLIASTAITVYAWGIRHYPEAGSWTIDNKLLKCYKFTRRSRWIGYFILVAYLLVHLILRILDVIQYDGVIYRTLANGMTNGTMKNHTFAPNTTNGNLWTETQVFFNCSGIWGPDDWLHIYPNQTHVKYYYNDHEEMIGYMEFVPAACCEFLSGYCAPCKRKVSRSLYNWGCQNAMRVWVSVFYGAYVLSTFATLCSALMLHFLGYCNEILMTIIGAPPEYVQPLSYRRSRFNVLVW